MVDLNLSAGQITAIKNYIVACRSDIITLENALSMAEYQ
jgi:hypothetical protein